MILTSRQWQVVTSIMTLVEKLQSNDDYIQTTTTTIKPYPPKWGRLHGSKDAITDQMTT